MTAEECLNKITILDSNAIKNKMIEFAKYHVEKALDEVSHNLKNQNIEPFYIEYDLNSII